MSYSLDSYDYDLPPELIAQSSISPHHDSRLMIIDRASGSIIEETTFWHILDHIPSDRVIYFNNSRVIRARIEITNMLITLHDGREKLLKSGEIFLLSIASDQTFEALVRGGKMFPVGARFTLYGEDFTVVGMTEKGRLLRMHGEMSILDFFEQHGVLPLPPYIEYSVEKEKDYQSVFAAESGSVAAPTASLHWTRELLDRIENPMRFVTLHIGLGTFAGIQTEDVRDFDIHSEQAEVPFSIFSEIAAYRQSGRQILGVGTTACRTLESLPYLYDILSEDLRQALTPETRDFWDSIRPSENHFVGAYIQRGKHLIFSTRIYIYPGFSTRIIEDMVTNFHLPKSSLLVFIAAVIGYDRVMELYRYAIEQGYRFFSFGDAMYIRGKTGNDKI